MRMRPIPARSDEIHRVALVLTSPEHAHADLAGARTTRLTLPLARADDPDMHKTLISFVALATLAAALPPHTLAAVPDGPGAPSTQFTWEEVLTFPWWLGGPVGEVAGNWVRANIEGNDDAARRVRCFYVAFRDAADPRSYDADHNPLVSDF